MFVRNAWYVAGWSAEVGRDLLARTVCARPVVLYRTQDGSPVALADACWHRLVPLSLGQVRGDDLMCGYHGITYSPQGRCTFMPSQETINPSASVASFPVVDRYRLCWVWLGDPELADPDRIPDILSPATDPGWAGDGELLHLECDYRFVLDNLMDLTHETYVHGTSIGQASVAESPFTVEHTEDTVTVTRWMYGIDPPAAFLPELQMRFPAYDGSPVDRWQIIRWAAPSTIVIDVGVALPGTGADRGDFARLSAVRSSARSPPRPTQPPTISGSGCVTTPSMRTSSPPLTARWAAASSKKTGRCSTPSRSPSTHTPDTTSSTSTSTPAAYGRAGSSTASPTTRPVNVLQSPPQAAEIALLTHPGPSELSTRHKAERPCPS